MAIIAAVGSGESGVRGPTTGMHWRDVVNYNRQTGTV